MSSLPNVIEFPAVEDGQSSIRSAASGSQPPELPKKRARRKKKGHPYLQFEEVKRFFKAVDAAKPPQRERDRAIFRLTYHAGLRASEVGMLQLRDYNPKADRIFINRLKGSNSGEHPLMREESRALRAWLKIRGDEPGAIFPSRKKSPISRDQLDVLMKQYAEAAGLPVNYRHMHIWKHTCCTHMRAMGKSVEDIQDWVGHVNIQNSLEYSHLTNARRDEMARSLKDIWR